MFRPIDRPSSTRPAFALKLSSASAVAQTGPPLATGPGLYLTNAAATKLESNNHGRDLEWFCLLFADARSRQHSQPLHSGLVFNFDVQFVVFASYEYKMAATISNNLPPAREADMNLVATRERARNAKLVYIMRICYYYLADWFPFFSSSRATTVKRLEQVGATKPACSSHQLAWSSVAAAVVVGVANKLSFVNSSIEQLQVVGIICSLSLSSFERAELN